MEISRTGAFGIWSNEVSRSQREFFEQNISLPPSWGKDTISISAEAASLAQANAVADAPALGGGAAGNPDDMTSLRVTVNGKEIDMGGNLQEIAASDFAKFREILAKLSSPDPGVVLDALAELGGVSRDEMQQTIANMSDDELAQFAAWLSKITGVSYEKNLETMYAIQEMNPVRPEAEK